MDNLMAIDMEQLPVVLADNEGLESETLERLADLLLARTLKNRRRTKAATEEYPILSERQIQRRLCREVPFTGLPRGLRLTLGLTVRDEE